MANKKTAAPSEVTDALGPMTPEARQQEATGRAIATREQSEMQRIYGDGEPYERERSVTKCRAHLRVGAEEFIRGGAELLLMKRFEEPGTFHQIVTERLNLPLRAAQRMMQATQKFMTADGSIRPLLTDANVNSSKVIELLAVDDDDLEALENGERVLGITKDDIQNMSVSELRKALRASREEEAANQDLLRKKEERVSKLERDLSKAKRGGVEFQEHAYAENMAEVAKQAASYLTSARQALQGLASLNKTLLEIAVPPEADGLIKRDTAQGLHDAAMSLGQRVAEVIEQQRVDFADWLNSEAGDLDSALGGDE